MLDRENIYRFHCDEVIACYFLMKTSKFRDASVIRSNDAKALSRCDVLVDIGGVYDHTICRYDHTASNFRIRLFRSQFPASSAGLVYYHYGIEALSEITGINNYSDLKALHGKLYSDVIHAIDCTDNGISMCDDSYYPMFEDNTTLWTTVNRLNRLWYDAPDPQEEHAQFLKAVNLAGSRFSTIANNYSTYWLNARDIVEKAYSDRHKFHPSGKLIYIPDNIQWKGCLLDLMHQVSGCSILYCVQQLPNKWMVRFTMDERASKNQSLLMPEKWRGLSGKEAEKATKIPGVSFIHKKGHLLFADSFEAAKAVAIETIRHQLPTSKPTR